MINIILLILFCLVGIILSKSLLYIYNGICYHIINSSIKKGGEKTQKTLSKILVA